MIAVTSTLQRINTLAPLDEIISRLDSLVSPVDIQNVAPDLAIGCVLGADVIAIQDLPGQSLALQDGWAVASEQIAGASSYSPTVLSAAPFWVDAGQRMPAGTDAVLPADALTTTNDYVEVHAPVASGEGVLQAGSDAAKGMILRRFGHRVRSIDVTVLNGLVLKTIAIRAPRVKIFSVSKRGVEDNISPIILSAARANGGVAEIAQSKTIEEVFSQPDCDALITIGGTGAGKNDTAIRSLTHHGKVEFYGFGLLPGQTAALGTVNDRIVLMLPGRVDAALSVFLTVGRHLMARLTGSCEKEPSQSASLMRKVTSTIGMAEVVFVRRVAEGIEPLGGGMFPLQRLMQADGWIFIPSGSEGMAAGTTVEVRNLP